MVTGPSSERAGNVHFWWEDLSHRVRMSDWWYDDCSRLGRGSANNGEVVHFTAIIALLVVRLTVVLAAVRAAITLLFATTMPADVLLQFFISAGLELLI